MPARYRTGRQQTLNILFNTFYCTKILNFSFVGNILFLKIFLTMDKKAFSFEISSTLPCRKDLLWEHIVRMPNVNKELMPYMRMTYPADMAGLSGGEAIPFGETLFMSVILLFGFIPMDLHWLRLDNLVEGKAFYENSTTLVNKSWKHTRSLIDKGNGKTELTDELEFIPRFFFMGYVVLTIVKFIFRHRHQQLRRTFG